MKNFIKAFRLTTVMCVFLGIGYVLVLWLFAKVAGPGNGNAETVVVDGKVVARGQKSENELIQLLK